MDSLSPAQALLLAIAVPPLLVILAALGWQRDEPRKPRSRGGDDYA